MWSGNQPQLPRLSFPPLPEACLCWHPPPGSRITVVHATVLSSQFVLDFTKAVSTKCSHMREYAFVVKCALIYITYVKPFQWTYIKCLTELQALLNSKNNVSFCCSVAVKFRTTYTHWIIFSCEFFFFSFIFIHWRLITLQYCSSFCHTLTWISLGYTCIPHPDSPSHLPLHPIPLGLPSAPGPSTCLMHPTWAGDLFHYK